MIKSRVDKLIREMNDNFTWDNNENDNKYAFSVLKKLLRELNCVKPIKDIKNQICSDYLRRLFAVRNALHKGEFGVACHELTGLEHCHGLSEVRIYANIKNLLEEYCD